MLDAPEARFVAAAWLAAPLCRVSLRAVGLRRTLRAVERLSERRGVPHAGPPSASGRAAELVSLAWRLGFANPEGDCLARALVEYGLQRHAGARVRFVIGVQPRPGFAAHAWVEPSCGSDGAFEPLFVAGGA
jgi:hypothetical protein